jgi:MSHA biogenesis protein MshN
MGVYAMSLINKMLQDLDQRRADIGQAQPFGQQVRAVPERRRVNPVWWGVAGLAVCSSGVAAWLWLQQASSQPATTGKRNQQVAVNAIALTPAPAEAVKPVVAVQAPIAEPVNLVKAVAPQPEKVSAPAAPAGLAFAALSAKVVESVARQSEKATESVTVAVAAAAPRTLFATPAVRDSKPQAEMLAAVEPTMPVATKRAVTASAPARATDSSQPAEIESQVKESTPAQLAESAYRKALLAEQQGRRVEMVNGLEQALLHDPRHIAARLALVGELTSSGRRDDAMRIARYGLGFDPNQSVLAMALARLQVEKGELRPAIATLEQGLPGSVDRADYRAFLAALLQRDGKHKQAVEHYRVAVQGAPQNGIWWVGLGISLQADNNLSAAQDAFRKAKATNALSADMLAFVEAQLEQLK